MVLVTTNLLIHIIATVIHAEVRIVAGLIISVIEGWSLLALLTLLRVCPGDFRKMLII